MPREVEPSTNAKSFILQALKENQRLDSRSFEDFRKINLSLGEEHGYAGVGRWSCNMSGEQIGGNLARF